MKKALKKVLRHSPGANASASWDKVPSEREIVEKLERWLAGKGYCIADESMSDVCRRIGLTRFELTWVSKSVYGENFLTLRKRMRIAEAARLLLEDNEEPIAVVAVRVGIPDKSNFRRQFAEVMGLTPQEWRDIHDIP